MMGTGEGGREAVGSEWRRGDLTISTDRSRLDRHTVLEFLRGSYWAAGIPGEIVDRSIENALCFGVYDGARQVAFARVISDFATFAYLADVFVLGSYRRRGIATWLMEVVRDHPYLRGLRRWMLVTRDAHGLYRKFGFAPLAHPDRVMEISVPNAYTREGA